MVEMELVYADTDLSDVGELIDCDADFDIGDQNNFELTFDLYAWDGMVKNGGYVYVKGTEYGGRTAEFYSDTSKSQMLVRGYTWRGLLDKKIICPADGEDYYTVSGELNANIRQVLTDFCSGIIFHGSYDSTGVNVTYQFNRYCTVLSGLTKMLADTGYRLDLEYVPLKGVTVSAVPIKTGLFSSDVNPMDFTTTRYYRGVNHMICLGQGDLAEREVIHLYVEADGSIGDTQCYFDDDEIVDTYDYGSAESSEELYNGGVEKLEDEMDYDQYVANIANYDSDDIMIGDVVTGDDTVTGVTISQPIIGKICKRTDGIVSIEYKLEG